MVHSFKSLIAKRPKPQSLILPQIFRNRTEGDGGNDKTPTLMCYFSKSKN